MVTISSTAANSAIQEACAAQSSLRQAAAPQAGGGGRGAAPSFGEKVGELGLCSRTRSSQRQASRSARGAQRRACTTATPGCTMATWACTVRNTQSAGQSKAFRLVLLATHE